MAEEDRLGWTPPVAFDAALHIRMGDACGPRAKRNQGVVRKCVLTLHAGLAPLLAHGVVPRGGKVFLATDSQRIAQEADMAAAHLPFDIVHLHLDRGKYDSEAWIELASAREHAQAAVLEETLPSDSPPESQLPPRQVPEEHCASVEQLEPSVFLEEH